MTPVVNPNHILALDRQDRLRAVMKQRGVPALLTSDPINILYACGARNMTVFGMMGPSRFVLVFADGPVILYEFAGCEHLVESLPTVDDVRPAPGITANSGDNHHRYGAEFAAQIISECRSRLGGSLDLAVERVDFAFTDALRSEGAQLHDATAVFLEARNIKTATEVSAMYQAIERVDQAVAVMESAIFDGLPEVQIWAAFHHQLIAGEGEYVSTRLLQGGPNTFPYFNEAGPRPIRDTELLCLDTDAIGYRGYAVDFSRTFLCGDQPASAEQRNLYGLAHEQLQHNASLLAPGLSYEAFARQAWAVPDTFAPYGYYCLAHGIGLCGQHPNVPLYRMGQPYQLPGQFEAGMTVCVESYIGCPDSRQGVKLEDQYLITPDGAERMTTYPFDDRLLG